MKYCTKCTQWLPREAFTRNVAKKDGLQGYCRECQRAYVRKHYMANVNYYVEKAKRAKPFYRASLRRLLDKLKDVPCMDCGRSYPPWVMDFDHVRGTKAFNLGTGPERSQTRIVAEIAKSDLVCSNCHRQRTHSRRLFPPAVAE